MSYPKPRFHSLDYQIRDSVVPECVGQHLPVSDGESVLEKNLAFPRLSGCHSLRRYSTTFRSGTTARSALGRRVSFNSGYPRRSCGLRRTDQKGAACSKCASGLQKNQSKRRCRNDIVARKNLVVGAPNAMFHRYLATASAESRSVAMLYAEIIARDRLANSDRYDRLFDVPCIRVVGIECCAHGRSVVYSIDKSSCSPIPACKRRQVPEVSKSRRRLTRAGILRLYWIERCRIKTALRMPLIHVPG